MKSSRAESQVIVPGYLPLIPIEAEKAFLGCLLTDEGLCQEWHGQVSPEDFGDPANRYLMRVITSMQKQGIRPDISTISTIIGGPAKLANIGGFVRLTELYDAVSSTSRITDYAEQVRQGAAVRRIGAAGHQMVALANVEAIDRDGLAEMLCKAEGLIMGLSDTKARVTGADMEELTEDYYRRLAEYAMNPTGSWGMGTGLTLVTNMIRGLRPAKLIVLAARSGMGKTTAAGIIAAHVATSIQEPVIFFSMEMSKEEIYNRLAVNLCGVSRDVMESGQYPANTQAYIKETIEKLRRSSMYINDRARVSPAYVRSETLRYQARIGRPVKLIVLDYLQRMDADSKSRTENRVSELDQITVDIKTLASDLGTTILATAQVGRQVESRENKRPMMSDLRGCGQIEQEADTVAFIYRESYYAQKDSDEATRREREMNTEEVEVIFAKNRDGSEGTVKVGYTAGLSRFEDLPEGFTDGFDGPTPF